MKVAEIIEELSLVTFSTKGSFDCEIAGGYCSDLLSDVIGNVKEGEIWITLHTHRNIVAVAALKDVAAIILINNAVPDSETLIEAEREEILVLGSSLSAFEVCGKLYSLIKQ